jgi:hypothetical protein
MLKNIPSMQGWHVFAKGEKPWKKPSWQKYIFAKVAKMDMFYLRERNYCNYNLIIYNFIVS